MDFDFKTVIEIMSAIFILAGFELFNRKSIKAFFVMAVGQLLAMIICSYAELWFLSFMHFVNFAMQIRGWLTWKTGKHIENINRDNNNNRALD